MEELLLSIKFAATCWVIVTMLTSVLDKFKISRFDKYLCIKCITFWSTLAVTQSLFVAAIASLIAYIISVHIVKKEVEL